MRKEKKKVNCAVSESMDEWLNRIGSPEALEQRKAARQAGKLNRKIPTWGLSKCVQYLIDNGLVQPRRPAATR